MSDKVKFQNVEDISKFLFAGHAILTIESAKTGNHFTFSIKTSKKDDPKACYFVSVLTGPNNDANYTYLGTIFNKREFKLTAKSKITADALSYKSFSFLLNNVSSGKLHEDLNVYHFGTCGRCGRTLTTPESIIRGLGPECAKIKKQK